MTANNNNNSFEIAPASLYLLLVLLLLLAALPGVFPLSSTSNDASVKIQQSMLPVFLLSFNAAPSQVSWEERACLVRSGPVSWQM